MEKTRFKSEKAPCERGITCLHSNYCLHNEDRCAQMVCWQSTGMLDLSLPREPKTLIGELNKLRNRDPLAPSIMAKQTKARNALLELTDADLEKLAVLIGHSVKTLKSMRLRAGMSTSFLKTMESNPVKNFLAKTKEAA